MSFKCFFNSHFVFVSQIHISFLQGSSFRFAVITGISKEPERDAATMVR